jgi:hypothetical protein
MKRLLLVVTTVTLLLTFASSGEAWQVNIKNSCNKDVFIQAMGHHLFWSQVDCELTVGKGTTGTCNMPGAICPIRILGQYVSGDSVYDLDRVSCTSTEGIPCCWNVNVEVIQKGNNACYLLLR